VHFGGKIGTIFAIKLDLKWLRFVNFVLENAPLPLPHKKSHYLEVVIFLSRWGGGRFLEKNKKFRKKILISLGLRFNKNYASACCKRMCRISVTSRILHKIFEFCYPFPILISIFICLSCMYFNSRGRK
jgi:hypothetical protein